jgi:hypothetical protein
MMRSWFGVSVCAALVWGAAACDSGSSRPASPSDACLVSDCSDGAAPLTDAAALVDAGKPPRDASIADDASSGAVFGFDGSRPPYDAGPAVPERDAEWIEGGPTGPGGPVVVTPPAARTACTNAGPIGFSTASLTAYSAPTGADPFQAAWAAAVQRTAAPGPALIVLDDIGLVPDGGARRARVGASGSAAAPFAFVQTATNPVAFPWALDSPVALSGGTGAAAPAGPGTLRFKSAGGAVVEIPFASAQLSARLLFVDPQSDAANPSACTGLDVASLALAIPATAGATLLEGQSLASMLGAPNVALGGANAYWRVVLRGQAPLVQVAP